MSTNARLSTAIVLVLSVLAAPAMLAQHDAPLHWMSLSPGVERTCGVTTLGDAYCWGRGDRRGYDLVPRRVANDFRFSAISVGGSVVCAIDPEGLAYCWGSSFSGALGIDSAATFVETPAPVSGRRSFAAVGAAFDHVCGLTVSGSAFCWGENHSGSLGTGDTANRAVPVSVVGGLRFKALAVGDRHTCGLTMEGVAYCWGDNMFDALGTTSGQTCGPQRIGLPPPACSTSPVAVAGALRFDALVAGGAHTCGITGNGVAYCWGNNIQGQLGVEDTSIKRSATPLAVAGGLHFSAIGAGTYQTCGLATDGHAYCWGENQWGEVGVAPLHPGQWPHDVARTPVPVSGGLTFRRLAVGGGRACGIAESGDAHCWGAAYLGNGASESSSLPVRVAEPSAEVAARSESDERQADSAATAATPVDSVLLGRALKARPEDLAQGFLAETYGLVFAKAAASGVTVHTSLDGRYQTIDKSNADAFVTLYRQRLKTYDAAIRRRSFVSIAGTYHTTVNRPCAQLGLADGATTISQHDFRFDLLNNSVSYSGVVVESAVVIEPAFDPDIHIAGGVATGRITLRQKESNCVLTLTRS